MAAVEPLPSGRRFVVIAASSMQAPGATGTEHRLHLAMDLVSLPFLEVVSEVPPGETPEHCTSLRAMSREQTAARPRAKACMRRSRRGPTSWYG